MDLNNKLTLISDLELGEIRCKIENVNKKGEKTYITVYNILGNQRVEILKELEDIVLDKEVNEEMFNNFYISLIVQFTDLIMDKEDILFMLNEGNLTSRILMQEINDMIYELQYESAMDNLAHVRTLTLNMLAQKSLEEMKYAEDRLVKEVEKRKKLVKHNTNKRNRQHRATKKGKRK